MNRIIPILLLVLSTSTFAGDLSQLYEKAYFLETAKGDTEEALEIYRQIVSSDATDENQSIIIQSLERMLALTEHLQRLLPKSKEVHF